MTWQTLQPREKQLLMIWPVAMAAFALFYFWPSGAASASAQRFNDIPTAEQRVARLRQVAASIPAREKVLEEHRGELASREQGLMRAPTLPQEQANLVQLARRLTRAQGIELQQSEIGPVQPLGKAYSETLVSVSFNCRIEQLVNLLADISAQKELVATRDIQVRQADQKLKTVAVRLTISAAAPKEMAQPGAAKG